MAAVSAPTPAPVMAEPPVRHRGVFLDGRGQQRVVVVGEQLGQPGRERGVGGTVGRE
jgi:hypothetical protein